MENNGYCLAYRKAWTHDAFNDLLEAAIWNYLYQNAFYEDGQRTFNGVVYDLKRGQIITTPRFIAKGFRIAESNARRVIQKLIKLKSIETQTTTKATIITICNYDKYQLSVKTNEDQTDNQTKNKRKTNDANNNKRIKEIKNKEIKDIRNLPEWMPVKEWQDFKQMRKDIKKPMTDRAEEKLITKLDRLRNEGYDPARLLDRSIINQWQDVFQDSSCKVKGEFSGMFG